MNPVSILLIGKGGSHAFDAWGHWIAFALLLGLGLHMIRNGLKGEEDEPADAQRHHGIVRLALTGLSASPLPVGQGNAVQPPAGFHPLFARKSAAVSLLMARISATACCLSTACS